MENQNREIEKKDKQKVINFFKTKGLEARHFPKKKSGKKPDFELYLNSNFFGYCELKSISKEDWAGGSRPDPTYNRIQNKIHEACKQLREVNQKHTFPNIVVIINREKICGWPDLVIVLKGKFPTSDKGEIDFDTRFRNRLLRRGDLKTLDLAIWIDNDTSKTHYLYNNNSSFKKQLKALIKF